MSHFTVLVPATNDKNLEEVLLPYHEYECTGIERYIEFVDETEEVVEGWKTDTNSGVRMDDGEVVSKYNKRFTWTQKPEGERMTNSKQIPPDGKEFEEISVQEFYGSIEEYAKDYHGYEKKDDKFGRMTNPNAKWDWYSVGGRYSGTLVMKQSGKERLGNAGVFGHGEWDDDKPRSSVGLFSEIDFEYMKNVRVKELHTRYTKFHKALDKFDISQLDQSRIDDHTKKYENWCSRYDKVVEVFPDAISYIATQEAFNAISDNYWWGYDEAKELLEKSLKEYCIAPGLTYAFVDTDGNWNQRGEMGWWGMDNKEEGTENYNEAWWQFIESLDPNQNIYVIDCHI